jgi:cytochrome c5
MKSDGKFMSNNGTVKAYAQARIPGPVFFRQKALFALVSLTIGFEILVSPTGSRAQNATLANQDAGQASGQASPTTPPMKKVELPDGPGKEIAEKSCQSCHELTNLTHASKNLDDWRDTVSVMIDNGADVPMEKLDILVKYLAKNFGPKPDAQATDTPALGGPSAVSGGVPPATASSLKPGGLPDGNGEQIAINHCQSCHTLSNLTDSHMSQDEWRDTIQLMMDRGANIDQDQVEPLVKYLAKNFGPKAPATASGAKSMSSAQPK